MSNLTPPTSTEPEDLGFLVKKPPSALGIVGITAFAVSYAALSAFWGIVPEGGKVWSLTTSNQILSLVALSGPTSCMFQLLRATSVSTIAAWGFCFLAGSILCFGGVMGGAILRKPEARLASLAVAIVCWIFSGFALALRSF